MTKPDTSTVEREMQEEFDTITDLAEAKACLKIAYRQSVNMYHGRIIWMVIAVIELLIIGAMYAH